MTDKKRILTQEGYDKITEELHKLKTIDRPAVIKRIAEARELGDLSENADYQDAREQQSFIEGRIKELEDVVKHAQIVSLSEDKGTVQLGSKITVKVANSTETYELVGSNEANPLSGKISIESPVGEALLEHKAGDKVSVSTPGGKVEYTIVEVA